ncbi:MAG: hypothetical protein JNM57_15630 [Cyclobacteriaceae bacterium]|nr:hypothetical protein [Cyclobacteriaceae bacterium]
MKNVFAFLTILVVAASCASTVKTKTAAAPAPSPVGSWDYSITGTPEGDFVGVITITEQEKKYAATMNANGNDMSFTSLNYAPETKKVTGDFSYSGTSVYFDADLNGDELTGKMSAGGMDFPFKATRKK